MNISISGFDNTLSIPDDGGIATLIVHNNLFFRRVVEDMLDIYTKREDNNRTVIYNSDHNPLNFAKDTLVITDIYSYDLANRTITAALYKNIQDNSDIDIAKLAQIEADILDVLSAINTNFSQSINYQTDISINDIMKMAHVGLEANEKNNYLDKLYGIIDSAQQLLSKRLVILINQRQLLSHCELQALLQYVQNNHFSVLFIEKNCKDKLNEENILVIDDDLYDFSTNS
ncbi:type II-A CRISPR-associated protein Csn2 [Candidatus Saccharibacteria bacterium oral taxon 955]|jgi:CRISPR-associated protein, csn2 family|nr:type II-A CRISPR-associated protein Csn2 [Candidatus Saccharibacteria bacterium oral taxon 955]QHU91146.1 type II-A CRISPR-associated protein Csn2 [Candidatus Saccharibacteria bacterium oral taxon 955]QJU06540.1 type II-A CRISPR-associated protein Csn2 [Candidatus Saccharibacteria bacterium oral taxon 955]